MRQANRERRAGGLAHRLDALKLVCGTVEPLVAAAGEHVEVVVVIPAAITAAPTTTPVAGEAPCCLVEGKQRKEEEEEGMVLTW